MTDSESWRTYVHLEIMSGELGGLAKGELQVHLEEGTMPREERRKYQAAGTEQFSSWRLQEKARMHEAEKEVRKAPAM